MTGDSDNMFYFTIFGKLVEPVVDHGAGITYLRLPSFQTDAFNFGRTDGVFYDRPETFEATVTAGRLAASETVTFAYPGDGLVPATRNDTFARPHADRNTGITLQWRAKTLATLRADTVNRDEQQRAGQLVFFAGGLLGLATGLLVEASLHRTRTQPLEFTDAIRKRRPSEPTRSADSIPAPDRGSSACSRAPPPDGR